MKETPTCYYCGGLLAKGNREKDHFPLPSHVGGELTVWICSTCHDMKDRYGISEWPVEWVSTFLKKDWPLLSREGRLLMAKFLSRYASMSNMGQIKHKRRHTRVPKGLPD